MIPLSGRHFPARRTARPGAFLRHPLLEFYLFFRFDSIVIHELFYRITDILPTAKAAKVKFAAEKVVFRNGQLCGAFGILKAFQNIIRKRVFFLGRFLCDAYFHSLGRELSLTVLLPTATPQDPQQTRRPAALFPALYFVHGSGNDGSTPARYACLERYAQAYQIAIILFSHEDKSGRTLPVSIPDHPSGRETRLDDFESLIQRELPEFITSYFPVSPRREDTYIAGLSQGGYISLFEAMACPGRFCAAGIFSGMFFTRSCLAQLARLTPDEVLSMPEEELSARLLPEFGALLAQSDPAQLPRFFFARGEKETSIAVCSDKMAALLAKGGANVFRAAPRPYGHEWQNWEESLVEFLEWLPRTDPFGVRPGPANQ